MTDSDSELFLGIYNSFARQELIKTLGAKLTKVLPSEVHIEQPFSNHISQHHGFVHAGAIASVIDSACGYAALSALPEGRDVVTAEYKINLLRPAI
ncbi:hotdog fold thioesterase [Pseudomonas sp. S31]|uniref:PaaI family thioesterase n=1 Tax=Pseudomonas sp. S31 TaxID=1564473 RepID=UPI00191152DD|nr:PaaI family thioesterase [Pseudomonas sp. S31]MBK4998590.1 hotdog fold thioesterase [Pseudomonas sp. S31]